MGTLLPANAPAAIYFVPIAATDALVKPAVSFNSLTAATADMRALWNEADRLRTQALVFTTVSLLAASTLPASSYYYVFQHDGLALGPFAWAHWAVVAVACCLGLLAHSQGTKVLLAAHAALGCMLGAALGGFDTAFWYTLDTRCLSAQVTFRGCATCACAVANTCTAQQMVADPTCHSCTAYPLEACNPVAVQSNKFILAFTGLTALVFLALPVTYSLLVLGRLEASSAAAAAKRQMVSFAVDQQTALVESGEKPTVTPAMLAAWVGFLLDNEEKDCVVIAEKCRTALASRGFELPVVQRKKNQQAPPTSRRCWFGRRKAPSSNSGMQEIHAAAASSVAEQLPWPPTDPYAASELGDSRRAGSKPLRGSQVAAEDRKVQFMQHS